MAADPHELADRLYPALAKQIRAVLNSLRDATDLDAFKIPDEVIAAVQDVLGRVAAATAAPTAAGFGVNFNSVNPAVVSWAERYTGQLITQITEESRQAIRDAIVESLRQGTGAAPTARDLRQYIGLNGPQARALARFEASMETPSPRLVERRAARMLRERATMIARTELITASNQGQQAAWNYAGDNSLIPETAFKEWLASGDERTCPICSAMNGTRVPFRSEYMVATRFDAGGGALNVEPKMVPPAHPMCRCAMVLVNLDG